jgi:PAS domain-containing protein
MSDETKNKVGKSLLFVATIGGLAVWIGGLLYAIHKDKAADAKRDREFAAMSTAQRVYSALIDSSGYGIAVLDTRGRVVDWNPMLEIR